MALLNRILGKNDREEKLRQEIKSLELRKESVLASINNEIIKLQSEQNSLFLDAGKYAYDIWSKDKSIIICDYTIYNAYYSANIMFRLILLIV